MKRLLVDIEPNGFFWQPTGSKLDSFIQKIDLDLEYVNLLLGYDSMKQWGTTDVFQFFGRDTLDRLRSGNLVLCLDATLEGFGPDEVPIARSLSASCIANNIDPKNIFFFTGNLAHRSEEINVVPLFLLTALYSTARVQVSLEWAKKECEKNYEKFILSLSRRNRHYRVFAHFYLAHTDLLEHSIVSQDRLDNFMMPSMVYSKLGLTVNDFENFKKSLPFIADEDNFNVNDPANALHELHSKTLFSIVNETLQDDLKGTTLFFSEKFLKPIINFQPMVMYGHPGVNRKLADLGFKTYEDYFDLDFDDEPDHILRYKKLVESVKSTVDYLKTLNRTEQIAWRFKSMEVLEHNNKVMYDLDNSYLTSMKQLVTSLLMH